MLQSGEKAVAPIWPAPLKDGFLFDGWYNGNTKYDFDTHVTEDGLILTAKWKINADPVSLDFGTAGYGDVAPETKTVTLANPNEEDVTVTLPTSPDYTVTAQTGFTDGKAVLAPNSMASFTVQLKAGIAAGTHDVTLTVFGDNDTIVNVSLAFTVTKAEQTAAPNTLRLYSRTAGSITLREILANANNVKAQYRMNGGDWQDSPVFTGLSCGTEYSFTARYA